MNIHSEVNLHAMRMGPGKHLKGLTLMNGLVTPEEVRQSQCPLNFSTNGVLQFDYFHEVGVRFLACLLTPC